MDNYSIVIGLCSYNNEKGLPYVFNNLKILSKQFKNTVVVFCYDKSSDNTLELIDMFKKNNDNLTIEIIKNNYSRTNLRTNNIANARNSILEFINAKYNTFDLFAMMDCNEYSCIGEIILDTLNDVFTDEMINNWDSVSFNREAGYYDYWALSFSPFIYSLFHCTNDVGQKMRTCFNDLLNININKMFYVYSAFNGFAIYKMNKFIDCRYSSNIYLDLFPTEELKKQTEFNECKFINVLRNDCEHRKFHLESIKKHNSKIAIYNKNLFKKIEPPIHGLRGPA
jgi:hypothetical protein